MPTVNHMIRKKDSFRMLPSISPPCTLLLRAIEDKITIITTANRSSTNSSSWSGVILLTFSFMII